MKMLKHDAGITPEIVKQLQARSLAWAPPERTFRASWPLVRTYFRPTVRGIERIPHGPTLFVGNHALFGIDILVLVIVIHHQTGRYPRVLGDQFFFASPVGEVLMKYGWILADRDICAAMMEAGEDLLVFPGGAAESTQAESEKYTLQWENRNGFVRMAAQHNYDITPFGMVGPDDCYRHLLEGHELVTRWPGSLLKTFGIVDDGREDLLPPLTSGLLGTQLPKPQPCFLAFGDPIHVPDYRGREVPPDILNGVKDQTAESIEALISEMLLLRAQQTGKTGLIRHLLLS